MHHAPAGLIATGLHAAPPAAVLRPRSLDEALGGLDAPGALPLAGGTDLCAAHLEGRAPDRLVSLDRLDELRALEVGESEVRLGALLTHREVAEHAGLRAAIPGLPEAWRMLANPRLRFRATLGGNLMARRTRYEAALLLAALGATLRFATREGLVSRTLDDLWAGRLPAPALLHHAAVPRRAGSRFLYLRELRPMLTLAIHRHDGGGLAAIGTEWLRPVTLALDDGALDGLPGDFEDPVVSRWYARRAGAALLRRGLEALDAA